MLLKFAPWLLVTHLVVFSDKFGLYTQARLQEISGFYDDMLEWAFAYDKASMSAKKMIVSHLIDRVYVFRDYRLQIKFNMSIEQFLTSIMGAA